MVFPLIRRRRRLVDVREAASNVLAGHVADSITNAEAVRAFAREPDEARIHARQRGRLRRQDAAVVGLPEPRVDHRDVADVRRHQHPRARRRAGVERAAPAPSLEAVFITFSYYATATRVMWEFNRIYRNLEGALTDAAQFAELLLEPPSVVDAPRRPSAFAPADFGVELRDVSFRYSPSQPLLFDRFRSGSRRARRSDSSDVPAAARRR